MTQEQIRAQLMKWLKDNRLPIYKAAVIIGISNNTLTTFLLGRDLTMKPLMKIEKYLDDQQANGNWLNTANILGRVRDYTKE